MHALYVPTRSTELINCIHNIRYSLFTRSCCYSPGFVKLLILENFVPFLFQAQHLKEHFHLARILLVNFVSVIQASDIKLAIYSKSFNQITLQLLFSTAVILDYPSNALDTEIHSCFNDSATSCIARRECAGKTQASRFGFGFRLSLYRKNKLQHRPRCMWSAATCFLVES